ncbi:early endosome antigen 1-like [Heptranchias perlo]|uniref:early endosome antigen 1-like n=1 Tax=Heptranchias perlo TaxID=212740 RepID=UPI0035598603
MGRPATHWSRTVRAAEPAANARFHGECANYEGSLTYVATKSKLFKAYYFSTMSLVSMKEYMKEAELLHRTDGPALAVLQQTAHVQRCRRVEELKEELERIKRRVSLVMDDYERDSKPVQAALCRANTEFMDDLNQLKDALLDSVKRQIYQKQVTIFIVGYQEACGERHLILSHLNEFFSKHIGFFMSEEQLTELDDEFEFEEVSERVDEALNSAEHATQHLAELNQEIINYMNTAVLNKDNKKRKRKLEKSLNQATEEIQKITAKLASTHSDLEEKEQKMKELTKQNDAKNLECMHFKSQVEITKKNMEKVQQELMSQKILLDHQSKLYSAQLEDLRKQLQQAHEKENLQPNAALKVPVAQHCVVELQVAEAHAVPGKNGEVPCPRDALVNAAIVPPISLSGSEKLENQNQQEPLCEQQDGLKEELSSSNCTASIHEVIISSEGRIKAHEGHRIDMRSPDAYMALHLREPCHPVEALCPVLLMSPFQGECDEALEEQSVSTASILTEDTVSELEEIVQVEAECTGEETQVIMAEE